jgi:hypothetical protein
VSPAGVDNTDLARGCHSLHAKNFPGGHRKSLPETGREGREDLGGK